MKPNKKSAGEPIRYFFLRQLAEPIHIPEGYCRSFKRGELRRGERGFGPRHIVIADVDDPEARLVVPFENRREGETKFLV